jgi:predicted Fe-Mo cluster-binding NifX family protein
MKGILFSLFLVLLLAPLDLGGDDGDLKIAVASQGKTIESPVAQRAARAPYFLLFGKDGELQGVLDNPHKDVNRRAGTGAAELLAQNEVTLVVAGVFGDNMTAALDSKAIRHMEFAGKVEEAVQKALDQ